MDEQVEEKKKPYRVKHGHHHYADGQFCAGGSTVMLTDAQYAAFKDKFVTPDEPLPPPPEEEDDDEGEEDEDENDGGDGGDDGDSEDEDGEEDSDDEEDDEDEQLTDEEKAKLEAEGDESPIAKRRREKAEKKAAKKAAKDAKKKK